MFKKLIKSTVSTLTAPYAVLCVFRSVSNTVSETSAYTKKQIDWHSEIEQALTAATNTECTLLIDNASHLVVTIKNSAFDNTNQITRIVRNHLMRNDPNHHVRMAAAQVDNENTDVDGFITEIYSNLNRSIEQKSSRIEVKHYKAGGS